MILLLILISSLVFVVSVFSQNTGYFTRKDTLKFLIILFGFIFLLYYSNRTGSSLTAYAFFLPVSLILQRSVFDFGQLLGVPPQFYQYELFMYEVFIYFSFIIIVFNNPDVLKRPAVPIQVYLIFVLFGIVSITWAYNKVLGMAFINNILILPISYYIFNYLFREEDGINYFIKGVFFLSLLQLFFTWPELFGFDVISRLVGSESELAQNEFSRVGGVYSKSNLAILLAITIPFIFSYSFLSRDNKKNSRLYILILFLLLSTLAITRHRMHVAATILGLFILLFTGVRKRVLNLSRIKFWGIVIFSLLFIFFFFTLNVENVEGLLFRETYVNRIISYYVAIMNFINSGGIGVGINNFLASPTTLEMLGPNSWFLLGGKTVHNDYLRILSELGLIGLIIFLLFIYSIFKQKSSNQVAFPITYGIKISLLVISIISLTGLTYNKEHILFLIGAFLALQNNINKVTYKVFEFDLNIFRLSK